jgi:hypothetical protein
MARAATASKKGLHWQKLAAIALKSKDPPEGGSGLAMVV